MKGSINAMAAGIEVVSAPYLLNARAAEAYEEATEAPRPRRANIHKDTEAAARAGFEAPVAAGAQTLAQMTEFLVDRFGRDLLEGGRLEVSFVRPVFFGDRLTAHAQVASVTPKAVELQIWSENHRGEKVMTGTASIAGGGG